MTEQLPALAWQASSSSLRAGLCSVEILRMSCNVLCSSLKQLLVPRKAALTTLRAWRYPALQ